MVVADSHPFLSALDSTDKSETAADEFRRDLNQEGVVAESMRVTIHANPIFGQ